MAAVIPFSLLNVKFVFGRPKGPILSRNSEQRDQNAPTSMAAKIAPPQLSVRERLLRLEKERIDSTKQKGEIGKKGTK